MFGTALALVVLVQPSSPSPVRFAGPAYLVGLLSLGVTFSAGRTLIDPSWGLWTQLGVTGAIDLAAIAVAVVVTHLPGPTGPGATPNATSAQTKP